MQPPHPPFIEARYFGGPQVPHVIVMHSTVTGTAAGAALSVANYFAHNTEKTSAHYVVDESHTYQCVKDHNEAFHCGHNTNSLGVEMCDYPSKVNRLRWLDPAHRRMFRRAVRLVARLCLAYDIPPVFLTADDLRAGRRGITTHAEETAAFHQSTHWDPGAWPRRRFIRAVQARIIYLKGQQP